MATTSTSTRASTRASTSTSTSTSTDTITHLLSVALGGGRRGRALAGAVLAWVTGRHAGVATLRRASAAELARALPLHSARRLAAALELGRVLATATAQRGCTIRGPDDVVAAVGERLVELEQEGFVALALDARGRLLRVIDVALGTRTSVPVGIAEAFREAVRDNAASIVFVHNHPSGDPTPSLEDRELTRQLTAAGRLLGIPVLDHIVLAAEGYRSVLGDAAAGAAGGEVGT